MVSHRRQAHLEAPVEAVWDLVGSPDRYPDWWPRVIEVRGERFEEGDEFVQVIRTPKGPEASSFHLDRVEELKEVRMTCSLTGTYAHWLLTPAQGGTFVEVELGMEPRRRSDRLFDNALGRLWFSRWSERSLAALADAARR